MVITSSKVESLLEFDTNAIKQLELKVAQETDEQILDRLKDRFTTLKQMTQAIKNGGVRSMIVTGPPGVGKSYGVESVLEHETLIGKLSGRSTANFEIVKGTVSGIGLFEKLFEYSNPGDVLVFDDCNSVLFDEEALDVLKGALDSGQKRVISWNKSSPYLEKNNIPNRFEYQGSVIFITNIKFEHVKSKKLKDHLEALESRSHYIDLQIDTPREKILRIKQVVYETGMLDRHQLTTEQKADLIDFVDQNKDKFRELSLRMILKVADLYRSFPNTWRSMARSTCMRSV
jgi:hypothetical protein